VIIISFLRRFGGAKGPCHGFKLWHQENSQQYKEIEALDISFKRNPYQLDLLLGFAVTGGGGGLLSAPAI
jgi:hypothetical protein